MQIGAILGDVTEESKKFSITLPAALVRELDQRAAEHFRNRNGEIQFALHQYLTALRAAAEPQPAVTPSTAPQPVQALSAIRTVEPSTAATEEASLAPDEAAEPSGNELEEFIRAARALEDWADASEELCQAALGEWHANLRVKGPRSEAPVQFAGTGYTGVRLHEWLVAQMGSMEPAVRLEYELPHRIHSTYAAVNPDQVPEIGQAVTELDVIGQYLAAARSVELGDGEPDEMGPVRPDRLPGLAKIPGFAQLAAKPDLSGAPVTARLGFARLDEGMWLPTPGLKYLLGHNIELDVQAAIYWPPAQNNRKARYGKRLDAWAKTLNEGRARLMQAEQTPAVRLALAVLKVTYAKFLGGMLNSVHNSSGTYRRDWFHQLVAQANANAFRAVDKSLAAGGQEPLGWMKDAFWWLSAPADAPARPAELVIPADGIQVGKWAPKKHGLVDQALIDAHQAGHPAILRDHINRVHNARIAGDQA